MNPSLTVFRALKAQEEAPITILPFGYTKVQWLEIVKNKQTNKQTTYYLQGGDLRTKTKIALSHWERQIRN